MPKARLLQEKIQWSEEQPLSDADISFLTTERNRHLFRLSSWYIPLALVLLYVLVTGLMGFFKFQRKMSDEDRQVFDGLVLPLTCGFFFFLLTVYFINMYLQGPGRLIRDIKDKKKLLLYYIPEKSPMTVFNRYYISSPVSQRQSVQVSEDDFYSIPEDQTITIEIAKYSYTVLRFTAGGKEIQVN